MQTAVNWLTIQFHDCFYENND